MHTRTQIHTRCIYTEQETKCENSEGRPEEQKARGAKKISKAGATVVPSKFPTSDAVSVTVSIPSSTAGQNQQTHTHAHLPRELENETEKDKSRLKLHRRCGID